MASITVIPLSWILRLRHGVGVVFQGAQPIVGLFGILVLALAIGGCAPTRVGLQARQFDEYWEALDRDYPFFDRQLISWDARRRQFRSAAAFARTDLEFFRVIAGMVSELEDRHLSFNLPDGFIDEEGLEIPKGLKLESFEQRLWVSQWPTDEPPAPSWLTGPDRHFPEVIRVEGFPANRGCWKSLAYGPPGSWLEIDVRWADGTVTRVRMQRAGTPVDESTKVAKTLPRTRPQREPDPATYVNIDMRWLRLGADGELDRLHVGEEASDGGEAPRILMVSIPSFYVDPDVFVAALEPMVQVASQSDVVVVDLTENQGGLSGNAAKLLEALGLPGHVRFRDFRAFRDEFPWYWRLLVDVAMPDWTFPISIEPSSSQVSLPPIVVLVSSETASAAEDVALTLQRVGGATVIGRQTAGAEAGVRWIVGRFGGMLIFGAARHYDGLGRGLEGHGVVPNVVIPLSLAEIREDIDRFGSGEWNRRLEARSREALVDVLRRELDRAVRKADFEDDAAQLRSSSSDVGTGTSD